MRFTIVGGASPLKTPPAAMVWPLIEVTGVLATDGVPDRSRTE